MITYLEKEYTVAELSRKTGMSQSELHRRWNRGLRDRELTKRVLPHRVVYDHKVRTLSEVSKLTGISMSKLQYRYARGLRGAKLVFKQNANRINIRCGSKLSKNEVRIIYKEAHIGLETQTSISEHFNIHQSTVSDIKHGKLWSLITKEIDLMELLLVS